MAADAGATMRNEAWRPADAAPSAAEPVADGFGALFRYRVAQSPDAVGFRFEDEDFTNAEMGALVDRFRVSLRRDGLARGSRVGAFMYNSPRLLALFLACACEGIVFSPLNVALRRNDLAYALSDLEAELVVFDAELGEIFLAACEQTPVARAVVVGEMDEDPGTVARLEEWLAGGGGRPAEDVQVLPSDPLCIIYSGGTTGLPKGIVIPHFAPVGAALRFATMAAFSERECYFTTLQLSHSFAPLIALPFCLTYGHTFCFWRWWSASRYLDMVAHFGATISDPFIGMIATLLQTPPRPQDEVLRTVRVVAGLGGQDPVGMRLRAEFERRFGSTTFDLYGFTESNGLVAFEREDVARKPGSCGHVSPWFDLIVVDAGDRPLPPGATGEILVRPRVPHTIGLGYHNKPDVTVRTWRNLWLHTGDMGYLDEDGHLFYVGRQNHFLRRRGELVSAAEIEAAIMSYPDVVEAAVVSARSEFGEDEIRACVVSRDAGFAPGDLQAFLRDQIAAFKVPRYIDVLESLPRSGAKREIEKYKLQARALDLSWDGGDGRNPT